MTCVCVAYRSVERGKRTMTLEGIPLLTYGQKLKIGGRQCVQCVRKRGTDGERGKQGKS